jgi:soluble lytic murein transglycosylase
VIALVLALLAAHPAAAKSSTPAAPSSPAVVELGRGFAAYRAGDYHGAIPMLRGAVTKDLRGKDWALFVLAESEFYDGNYRGARDNFEKVGRGKGRPAQMAPFRIADCLWMEGDHAKAAASYAKLAKTATARSGDVALARFRVAENTAERNKDAARPLFLAIARDFPAHPLSDEALRRVGAAAPAGPTTTPQTTPPAADLPPADRLKRAESLSKDRHWDEALAELARLPATLPVEQAAERDYQIGMTKFHMRKDYPGGGALLLGAVSHLTGDKAASAQFHGARALSRADRDDEAIAGYRKVITQFPHSRYAAEAQYLSGWLEYNRGRFRESIPGFEATLKNFGNSAFADDAAWSLAFAHFLLGDTAEAAAGFERYGRLPPTGIASDEIPARVKYWRARLNEKTGKQADAEAGYRELAQRPFSFYGLLARARLKQAGHPVPIELPVKKLAVEAPAKPTREPSVARALELIEAGMGVEAGEELEANEKEILKHLGGDKALPWLIDLYKRAGDYRRVYRLAESKDAGALAADPRRDEGTRVMWEAAYPRAYEPLVEKYGAAAKNPELFLYAIMRKESGFNPHDVSYADARGLLQMIPPTSSEVAAKIGEPFFPDQLYEPEVNIRLGAAFIGSLYAKFGREIPLTAGAYNGGPRMMTRWCEQNAKYPTDEFIELIAFPQTREYAKRVTSIYAKYRYLYGATPYEIPLTLTTKVDSGGPN